MKYFLFFVSLLSISLSKPVHEEAVVDVANDNAGHYRYSFTSKNITLAEERDDDGFVRGSFNFLDEFGKTQSISYTAGVDGFIAKGTTIPEYLPEVAEARAAHLAFSDNLRSILPELKIGKNGVEVQEIVPLSKERLLEIVEKVAGVVNNEDVAKAKNDFLNLYRTALVV